MGRRECDKWRFIFVCVRFGPWQQLMVRCLPHHRHYNIAIPCNNKKNSDLTHPSWAHLGNMTMQANLQWWAMHRLLTRPTLLKQQTVQINCCNHILKQQHRCIFFTMLPVFHTHKQQISPWKMYAIISSNSSNGLRKHIVSTQLLCGTRYKMEVCFHPPPNTRSRVRSTICNSALTTRATDKAVQKSFVKRAVQRSLAVPWWISPDYGKSYAGLSSNQRG